MDDWRENSEIDNFPNLKATGIGLLKKKTYETSMLLNCEETLIYNMCIIHVRNISTHINIYIYIFKYKLPPPKHLSCHCVMVFPECIMRFPFIFSLSICNPLKSNSSILGPTEATIQHAFFKSWTAVRHLMAPFHTFPTFIIESYIYMNQVVYRLKYMLHHYLLAALQTYWYFFLWGGQVWTISF